ncbi:hypothetical protein CFAM422_013276 [Trichoderma lentiforme]|uniref:Uncharacterized protein n=1 Tax=Trichoderma lentiforme TaxID=1567552 RepID=A0A9P5C6X6_9HYPO|nr:hypothetical protein CFAM422_013276 [Trichoderma lentiforme]
MNLVAIASKQLINRMVAIDSSKEQIALNLENGIVDAVRLDKFALPRIALSVTYGEHQLIARLVNLAPIIRPCSSASFLAPLGQEECASPMKWHGSVAADSVVWGSEISILLHLVVLMIRSSGFGQHSRRAEPALGDVTGKSGRTSAERSEKENSPTQIKSGIAYPAALVMRWIGKVVHPTGPKADWKAKGHVGLGTHSPPLARSKVKPESPAH